MSDRPATSSSPSRWGAVATSVSCAEEFREDERLLRAGAPAVRVVVLSGRTVSYGVGVREDAPYLVRARTAGTEVARRSSGGTGVIHAPADLAWAVVLPRTDPRVGNDYVHGYARLGAGVVRFLRRYRIDASWTTPPGLSSDYCVLSGRGHVLSVGDRVLGGAAQHVTRSALLHQGMLPRSVDRALVTRLFRISDPDILGRLVGLEDLGVESASAELARQLADDLTAELGGIEG